MIGGHSTPKAKAGSQGEMVKIHADGHVRFFYKKIFYNNSGWEEKMGIFAGVLIIQITSILTQHINRRMGTEL